MIIIIVIRIRIPALNEEADNIEYDSFLRKGYNRHETRTRLHPQFKESMIARTRREVHAAHTKKQKLGKKRIAAIRSDYPRTGFAGVFPDAPQDEVAKASLHKAITASQGKSGALGNRQQVVDQLRHCVDPNQSEVNMGLGWFLRLNASNAKQVNDGLAVIDWIDREDLRTKYRSSVTACDTQINEFLCKHRLRSKKQVPKENEWALRYLSRMRTLYDEETVTDIAQCAEEDQHTITTQLSSACVFGIGKMLWSQKLAGVVTNRIDKEVADAVELYAAERNWSDKTMNAAIEQCLLKVQDLQGIEKAPATRTVSL